MEVRLRSWREEDAPRIVECVDGDPEIARWLDQVPQPYTVGDALAYIRRETLPDQVIWAIEADGRVVGSIGGGPEGSDVWEVGYWVCADARGRGVTTQALRLAAAWAFQHGAERVQLRENVASCRVAEKAGFAREGVLRSAHWNARIGRRQDWAMYSLLASER